MTVTWDFVSAERTRKSVALATSLLVHLAIVSAVLLLGARDREMIPLEVSIFLGEPGPASPPPGERGGEPGPVKEVPAPEAAPHPVAATETAARAERPASKPEVRRPPPPALRERGILGALRKSSKPVDRQPIASDPSAVVIRDVQRPRTSGGPTAPSRVDVDAADVGEGGPAVQGSLREGLGTVQLPGPGGSGSGWGAGESGRGGGGSGRGGFGVTGSGAGGRGRSHAAIWNASQQFLARLRAAYNQELRRKPTLAGTAVVRFDILASGEVQNVTIVSSALGDPPFERVVADQVRTWHYPPEPEGDVRVTWPLAFLLPSR